MAPTFFQIILLGLIQGAAELLPISSSAHVIVAEKLMRLDPTSPEMTFLLVMLHTGTMAAVIVYFWNAWKRSFFSNSSQLGVAALHIAVATALTLVIGVVLKIGIEKWFFHGAGGEVESLFGQLPLIAAALAAAGVLIIMAGFRGRQGSREGRLTFPVACWIGAAQGFCLPFRGLSRSGTTISTGLLLGANKRRVEEFSFVLAVVLTPIAILVELRRLLRAHAEGAAENLRALLTPGLFGMGCAFVAGLVALWLLSRVLETERWHYFGFYCLAAAAGVAGLALAGF